MTAQFLGLLAIAAGVLIVAITSYHAGREDERRAAEMREHLARVIGGRHA